MTAPSPAPALLASFDDLIALLEHDGVPHEVIAADRQVAIPTALGVLDSELLIVWSEEDLVQVIQPLPLDVPAKRLAAVEGAVARVNHRLSLPGFGLNHADATLYFRVVALRDSEGQLAPAEVERLFRTAVRTASTFLPLFQQVIGGTTAAKAVEEFMPVVPA